MAEHPNPDGKLVYSADTEATARVVVAELLRNGLKQSSIWLAASQPVTLELPPEHCFQHAADLVAALDRSVIPGEPSPDSGNVASVELQGRLEAELGAGRIVLAIHVAHEYRDAVARLVAMLSADVRLLESEPSAAAAPDFDPGAGQLAPA